MIRVPRVLRWILGVLVLLELAYVAAGVVLVRSGQVDRWLNKHPEKRVIHFESAWTIVPGVAHVRGFRMVNQGRGNQLELVVDHAVGFVNPLELPARRIHVLGLRARGVEFRYRKRPKTPEEAAARVAVVPPIEGIPFEPYAGPPKQKGTKPGWTAAFTGARVREVRDVWMGPFRLKGPAEVAASVTVSPGEDKRVSIRSADVRFEDGQFLSAGETSLTSLDLRVRGRMEPFSTKQTKGRALLELISARADLSATGPGAVLLNQYFGRADWLVFDSGPRHLAAAMEVEKGRVRAGSRVDLDEAPLRVDFAGFIAEGRAAATLEALPSETGDVADLHVAVTYTDYGIRREAEGPPVLLGDGLQIEARSPADLLHFPPDDFGGRMTLGRAELPQLAFVNEFLPGGAGLAVKGGRGTVAGDFEITEGEACQGRIEVTAADVVVDAGGVESTGAVAVTIEVPTGHLKDLAFAVGGTRVELSDFAFTSGGAAGATPDWRGEATVTEGTLELGETPGADIRLDVAFSDTRPLVAFLSRDKPLKGWKERMLTIEQLSGEGVARLEKGTAAVRHFGLRGGKVDIRFRALIDARGAFGKARMRYGILKAGIGLEGHDRDLKIVRVGHWYQQDDIPGMPALLPEFEEVGAK